MKVDWPFISLIIPCYNESSRLENLFEQLIRFSLKYKGSLEVVLVNDGSTDDTSNLINSFTEYPKNTLQLKFVDYRENKGKGYALKEGVAIANGAFLITLDADLSAHPDVFIDWRFNTFQSDQTIFIASREHEDSIIDALEIRRWSGRLFNFWVKWVTGTRIKDTQCGFKCYPNKIGKLLFRSLINHGWAHDVEIIYRAKKEHIECIPMPIKWKHEPNSKIALFKDGILSAVNVWQIKKLVDREYQKIID